MSSFKLDLKVIDKIIKNSKQASKNLESYDKGLYKVDVNRINSKIYPVIGRKL